MSNKFEWITECKSAVTVLKKELLEKEAFQRSIHQTEPNFETVLHKNKYEDFALEILEEKGTSLCGQQVKTIGVPGVLYSEESSELKTGNLKITIEMFLSSVFDTFNFKFLKEREFFYENYNAPMQYSTAENSNSD